MQNKRNKKYVAAYYGEEPTVGIVLTNTDAARYLAHLLGEKLNDQGIAYQIVHAETANQQINTIEGLPDCCENIILQPFTHSDADYTSILHKSGQRKSIILISNVVSTDSNDSISGFIGFDYRDAGRRQAQYVCNVLDNDPAFSEDGKQKVVLYRDINEGSPANEAYEGALAYLLESYPVIDEKPEDRQQFTLQGNGEEIEVLTLDIADLSEESVRNVTMNAFVTGNIGYTASLICCSDKFAIAAVSGLGAVANVSDYQITGMGGSEEIFGMIEDGMITQTVVLDYDLFASAVVEEIIALLNGTFEHDQVINIGTTEIPARFVVSETEATFDDTDFMTPDIFISQTIPKPTPVLSHITVDASKIGTYAVGQKINGSALSVKAYYTEGKASRTVTDYYFKPYGVKASAYTKKLSYGKNRIDVYYKEGDKEVSAYFTVTADFDFSRNHRNYEPRQPISDYSCSAGKLSLNLFTKKFTFTHPDLAFGQNSYGVAVGHVYRSDGFSLPENLLPHAGNNWKLTAEQFLYEKGDSYIYVDANGSSHEFLCVGNDLHYDTAGSGLTLIAANGSYEISDRFGNKSIFENGRLIRQISGRNPEAIKQYVYTGDRLTAFYDNRSKNKKLIFTYDNKTGRLSSAAFVAKNEKTQTTVTKRELHYFYNSDGYLTVIKEKQSDGDKTIAIFAYEYTLNGIKMLTRIVGMPDRSSLKINYSLLNASCVDRIYKGMGIVSPETESTDYTITNKMTDRASGMLSVAKINETFPEGSSRLTTVTNEKDLCLQYTFSDNGTLASVLERNGSAYDLRSLEKDGGVHMSQSGTPSKE